MADNSKTASEKGGKLSIRVRKHEPFEVCKETAILGSDDLCRKVVMMFKPVYADFDGCRLERDAQGKAYIELYFNHSEPNDPNKCNALTREAPDSNGKNTSNEMLRKIRSINNKMMSGDRFYLTEDGKDGIGDYVIDYMRNKKTGKIMWEKIVSDVELKANYVGQPSKSYTKVSAIDPIKIITEWYGSTTENGDSVVEYAIENISNFNPFMGNNMMNGPMSTTQSYISIARFNEKNVAKAANGMGFTSNFGMDIIRG